MLDAHVCGGLLRMGLSEAVVLWTAMQATGMCNGKKDVMARPVIPNFHAQQFQMEPHYGKGLPMPRCFALDARSPHRLELVVVIPELEPLGLEPRALRHEAKLAGVCRGARGDSLVRLVRPAP